MAFDTRIIRERGTGLVLDLTHAPGDLHPQIGAALGAMERLEAGAVANPDEGRMVGHYWLRAPERAPDAGLGDAIRASWTAVSGLDRGDHDHILLIGIGGSALGPALLADALARAGDPARLVLFDNTDPDGFARVLAGLDPRRTLSVVISKSGGTVETRNGMLAAMAWYRKAGLRFGDHAVAVTVAGSRLDRLAQGDAEGDADVHAALGGAPTPWRARLPLWSWVGGRTSVTGAVGLVPMQLCGWYWRDLIEGARQMDAACRGPAADNPAMPGWPRSGTRPARAGTGPSWCCPTATASRSSGATCSS